MRNMNDAELTAIEDGLVQSEVIRVWSSDSRFTSLSPDEMSARVRNYWVRKADSTRSQSERIDYFFNKLKYVAAPIESIFKDPALDIFQWLSNKIGPDAAHRAAIEAATKSISDISASIGLADYHAYLKQTNLIPLSLDLYQNTLPEYQPMILKFIVKDLFSKSMIVTNGFVHVQGEAIKGHDARFKQYDLKFKKLEAENARLKLSLEGMLSDQDSLKQAAAEFSEGKGELIALINNQLAQFHENQQMTQYVYQHIKNEEIQAKFKNSLAEVSSTAGLAVDVTSFVIGDVLGNRKLAQKVSRVGNSLIGLGIGIANCFAPTPPTTLLCITGVSGGFLSAVQSLIGSIGGGGPDQMEVMFDMLKEMAKDIKDLVKHFKEMDKFLHSIDEAMRAKFKETLEYLVYIANQVSEIKSAASAIKESIHWMTEEQYTLFKASNEITSLIKPIFNLKRSLQTEGTLLPGFIEKYIDFIAWPKKLAQHPSMTGLHMDGFLSANIRTMVASGRSLEDIIGAFAKFVCTENPAEESVSCLKTASALSNPTAWFMGAHEFVEILTLIHRKPHLLVEFSQRVPRFGDASRDVKGYCDDIAEIRNGGEQLIAWHESLAANNPLRKKLIQLYRAFLENLITETKKRIQTHAKAPGSWAHTIQGHLDRVEKEKAALANSENVQLVVPQVRFQVNVRQYVLAPAHLQNACFEWMNFYARAIENYRKIYQKEVEKIAGCFNERIDTYRNIQKFSPLSIVYSSKDGVIDGIEIEMQLAVTDYPISCILYPDARNAKENQIYVSDIVSSPIPPKERGKKRDIHPRYYTAETLGLGELKVIVKTSTVLTRETHFIAGGKSTLLMTETWPTVAPDSQVTNADIILRLNDEKNPQSNHPGSSIGLDGRVSSLLVFAQANKLESTHHFTDEDPNLQLEKTINDTLLKTQCQYLDETVPAETVDDAAANLLHVYLYFTLGSKYSLFSALSNFTLWTHKKIEEEISVCKKQLKNGKLCEDLETRLERSLKSLPNDEILIEDLLSKKSTQADNSAVRGMDTVRHQLVGIKFFEHKHCRRHASAETDLSTLRSECETMHAQCPADAGTEHTLAVCESIFGVKSSLFIDESVCQPAETSTWLPNFISRFFNWAPECKNEFSRIGNDGTSSEYRLA